MYPNDKVRIGIVDLGNGQYEAVSYLDTMEKVLEQVRGQPFDYVAEPREFICDLDVILGLSGEMQFALANARSMAYLLNNGDITREQLERHSSKGD